MLELTNSEKEVMDKIWERNEAFTSSFLLKAFAETKGWKTQTVSTFLSRLTSKGFLSVERHGTTNTYQILISKERYEQISTKQFLNKVYNGSVKRMIASLVDGDAIDPEELQALKDLLDEK